VKPGGSRWLARILLSLGTSTSLAAGLTGCGQANTTAKATEEAVLGAYKASHLDYLAVAETFPVNPGNPRISAHLTGTELAHVQAQLTQMKSDGQFIQGTLDLAAKVTTITDTSASVTDCNLDRTVFVDGRTRQPLSQPGTQRTLVYAKLQLVAGVWKVFEFNATGSRCLV
jgi:hypothetical protein